MILELRCQQCSAKLKAEVKIGGDKKVIQSAGWKYIFNVGYICPDCLGKTLQKANNF